MQILFVFNAHTLHVFTKLMYFVLILVFFPFRFLYNAMKRGSRGFPYLAEVNLDLETVGSKGALRDARLTESVQRG